MNAVATRTIAGRARRTHRRAARSKYPTGLAFPCSLQRECGALRVRASDHPASARCFKRTFEDLLRRRP